jgi:hypothetical protein
VQLSGSAAPAQENQACKQWEFWGLISHMGFRKHSSAVLLSGENKACWLMSSVNCGAAGVVGFRILG